MDFSNVDVKTLKIDLVKNATIIVVSRLLRYYLVEQPAGLGSMAQAFDTNFLYTLVFTLLAFVMFHLVVNPNLQKML